MKPLPADLVRLSRCPCCVSKYSLAHKRKSNAGKSAARQKARRELSRLLSE
jgi:hypothetical protein